MTKRHSAPGQLAMPDLIPDSFWVVTQGHGVIPDGRRFLVVENYGDGWWLAWENGVAPLHRGTLLREKDFRREADDDTTNLKVSAPNLKSSKKGQKAIDS